MTVRPKSDAVIDFFWLLFCVYLIAVPRFNVLVPILELILTGLFCVISIGGKNKRHYSNYRLLLSLFGLFVLFAFFVTYFRSGSLDSDVWSRALSWRKILLFFYLLLVPIKLKHLSYIVRTVIFIYPIYLFFALVQFIGLGVGEELGQLLGGGTAQGLLCAFSILFLSSGRSLLGFSRLFCVLYSLLLSTITVVSSSSLLAPVLVMTANLFLLTELSGCFSKESRRRDLRSWVYLSLGMSIIVLVFCATMMSDRYEVLKYDFSKFQNDELHLLSSSSSRLYIWTEVFKVTAIHPYFGSGLDGVRVGLEQTLTTSEVSPIVFLDDPHNQFLSTFIEFGIVGIFALAALATWIWMNSKQNILTAGVIMVVFQTAFLNTSFTAFVEGRYIWSILALVLLVSKADLKRANHRSFYE